MTAEEMRGIRELENLVRSAQSQLAGLQDLCKVLFLRVGQIKNRSPDLDGLVTPMDWEINEILGGIMGAQAIHSKMEKFIMAKAIARASGAGHE